MKSTSSGNSGRETIGDYSHDVIEISGIAVDCIVGIYPDERQKKQPLVIDLKLGLDFAPVVESGDLHRTCDYDRLTSEVIAFVQFRQFLLLEVAAEELAAMSLSTHPSVRTAAVEIAKPEALRGRAACARVGITRRKQDYPPQRQSTPFGSVETVLATNEAGLFLVHVQPGKAVPRHYHQTARQLEWLLAGEVSCNGAPLAPFAPKIWLPEETHEHENCGQSMATLFCCGVPSGLPDDMTLVG